MHKSGFVALAILILAIALGILALSGGRRDTTHGTPAPVTLGR